MTLVDDVLSLPIPDRRLWLAEQTEVEFTALLAMFRKQRGTPYALWADDPAGFITDVLGEYIWSKQAEVCTSVRDYRRTACPSAHGPGKTHVAARIVAWWVAVHPPGSALVVTTATTGAQVRAQLWPHIRRVVFRNNLPGAKQCNQTQWWIDESVVALGFSPNRYDEAAGQGFHAEFLLVVVDEAGGILPLLGNNLDSLMTGENSHILSIGNPPTEDESGWFEGICESPFWHRIRISAFDTPNFTGEWCPPEVAAQLVDKRWVDDIASMYGEDSAYYVARVLAMFPKLSTSRAVPVLWTERAMENEDPAPSDWQRLGIDVADGGGDEMVVAHADGFDVRIVSAWAGTDAADQVANAERVLEWIHFAEGAQRKKGYTDRKVRCKVDATGVGGGTADVLTRMGKDGKHGADIVHVHVGERATDPSMFKGRRDECWWTLREGCRDGTVRLRIDERQKAQICGPLYSTDTQGRIVVESKREMKRRGLPSPDHADAICLALYEPVSIVPAATYAQQMAAVRLPTSIGRRR